MQQRRAQRFFTIYTENRGLAIDACSNSEHRDFHNIYRKSWSGHCCMQQQRAESLLKTLKIVVSTLIHAAKTSTELLYNIYRKSLSRHSCIQQWRAMNFLIIYTENHNLTVDTCRNGEHRAFL